MMNSFEIKKCMKCGALVRIFKDCNCDGCEIVCCGEKMVNVEANSTDAAVEKHVPSYERKDGKIVVSVNHVMEEEHYIEWVALVTENGEEVKYLKSGDTAKVEFPDVQRGTLYAYCNKHGLWSKEI